MLVYCTSNAVVCSAFPPPAQASWSNFSVGRHLNGERRRAVAVVHCSGDGGACTADRDARKADGVGHPDKDRASRRRRGTGNADDDRLQDAVDPVRSGGAVAVVDVHHDCRPRGVRATGDGDAAGDADDLRGRYFDDACCDSVEGDRHRISEASPIDRKARAAGERSLVGRDGRDLRLVHVAERRRRGDRLAGVDVENRGCRPVR